MVRSHYIYLNTYKGGYMYVGSHTWDGPVGQLDPNYHGSSHVASNYGWVPIKEEILEVVTEDVLHSERRWIEKYAELYGIADCAKGAAHPKNDWVLKYKQHGLMLNLHCNDISNALGAHTKESYVKGHETRKSSDKYHDDIKRFREAGTKASLNRESIDKRNKARLLTVGREGIERFRDAGNTHEAFVKSALHKNYAEVHEKRSAKVRGTKFNRVLVSLYKNNEFITRGSVAYCCTIAGNRNWQVAVSRKLKKGIESIDVHGFTIRL